MRGGVRFNSRNKMGRGRESRRKEKVEGKRKWRIKIILFFAIHVCLNHSDQSQVHYQLYMYSASNPGFKKVYGPGIGSYLHNAYNYF